MQLTAEKLNQILQDPASPCISIIMPTIEAGPETRQNPIRFKSLLSEAGQQAKACGFDDEEIEAVLSHGKKLTDDHDLWQHTKQGLVIYLDTESARLHHLPLDVESRAIVASRPYVKPMLPLLAGDGRYYVLALSQKSVRFFEGSRSGLERVEIDDLPESMEDALGEETESQSLQFHSTGSHGGGDAPIYHGQGTGQDDRVADLRRFMQRIDSALQNHLAESKAPMILVGVERVLAEFRNVSDYGSITEDFVAGNHDQSGADALHEPTWTIAEGALGEERRTIASGLEDRLGTDLVVVDDIEAIVKHANFGRVETLFFDGEAEAWGTFDDEDGQAEAHDERQAGDTDLFEEAALLALRSGASVFAVDEKCLPAEASRVVALLRY